VSLGRAIRDGGSRTKCIATAVAGGLLACAIAAPSAAAPERIAVLNWGLAQTLLALGVEPIAVAETGGYRDWVQEPALPEGVIGLGRRLSPNLDVLASANPDWIVMSGYRKRPRAHMERIAPTKKFAIYTSEHRPLQRSREVAAALADRLGVEPALQQMTERLERALERLAAAAPGRDAVYIVQFSDAGHVRVFGDNALLGNVVARSPLTNAWDGATNAWGFSQIPITRLDGAAEHLIVLEPVPQRAREMMQTSAIWQSLPVVQQGHVHMLPPIWSFGGIPSAIRFAELITERLDDRD